MISTARLHALTTLALHTAQPLTSHTSTSSKQLYHHWLTCWELCARIVECCYGLFYVAITLARVHCAVPCPAHPCRLNLCRVPILGQASCAAAASTPVTLPKERAAVATASAPAPAVGTKQTEQLQPRPLIAAFNLTGLYPFVGFDSRFDPGVMGAQGRAAVDAGQISQITVVGASPLYNDYITGFVMWIERETPRYNTPKLPQLPPLPDKYKEDVAWVASLRRG